MPSRATANWWRGLGSDREGLGADSRQHALLTPSRTGKTLLAAQLPGIVRALPPPGETSVVDNGTDDGTAYWLPPPRPVRRA